MPQEVHILLACLLIFGGVVTLVYVVANYRFRPATEFFDRDDYQALQAYNKLLDAFKGDVKHVRLLIDSKQSRDSFLSRGQAVIAAWQDYLISNPIRF